MISSGSEDVPISNRSTMHCKAPRMNGSPVAQCAESIRLAAQTPWPKVPESEDAQQDRQCCPSNAQLRLAALRARVEERRQMMQAGAHVKPATETHVDTHFNKVAS